MLFPLCSQVIPSPAPPAFPIVEAVQRSLASHPLLRSQEAQVDLDRGSLLQAASIFDYGLQGGLSQTLTNSPLLVTDLATQSGVPIGANTDELTNLTSLNASGGQLLRNGIVIAPALQLTRETDNLSYPTGTNNFTAGLQVTIPLLRGRGRAVVAAQEDAAAVEVDAAMLDLGQLMAQLMANSADSYWNLLAANKELSIAQEAEARGSVYVSNTQALIDADHAPRNDINEVSANLAQRASARISAELMVVMAREQLALDMGLAAPAMLESVADPTDDFPGIVAEPDLPSVTTTALHYYLDQALKRRGDYLAARRRMQESGILFNASKNRLLPQMNLNVAAGYSGLHGGRSIQDFLNSPFSSAQGPNASVGITYSFPVQNQLARGAVLQADASVRQADVVAQQLARGISQEVAVAVASVRNAFYRVSRARESVVLFQASLDGAREKYRVGRGSIVEILTIEDKLTAAMTDDVQARLSYALALVQYRFATGELVQAGQASQRIPAATLFTLPADILKD